MSRPTTVWVPFYQETGVPLALILRSGRTVIVFKERGHLEEMFGAEGAEGRPMDPSEVLRFCEEHASDVDSFVWIGDEEWKWLDAQDPAVQEQIEELPLWRLKAWAQYVSGDVEGYRVTARKGTM